MTDHPGFAALLNLDARLDGVALLRAYLHGDSEGIKTINNNSPNAGLAVINLCAGLVRQNTPDPDQWLDNVAAGIRRNHTPNTTPEKES